MVRANSYKFIVRVSTLAPSPVPQFLSVEMALSVWQPGAARRLSMVLGKERKPHALAKLAELQYLWVLAGRGLWASGCV